MPDWNPDKEGHVEHRWIVHKATTRDIEGVETSKGFLKFNREGRCLLKDETLANEIRTSDIGKYDVAVTRVRYPSPADRGHKYFFGGWPEMPWKKNNPNYNEYGVRIDPEDKK